MRCPNYHIKLSSKKLVRRHISATILGITWAKRCLGDGPAEVDQSLGLLDPQIKPHWIISCIFYHMKINDHQRLKARTRDAVAMVTPNIPQVKWNGVEYRLDVYRATKGAHVEVIEKDIYTENHLDSFFCNGVTHKCV
jgi:hypothetical protein